MGNFRFWRGAGVVILAALLPLTTGAPAGRAQTVLKVITSTTILQDIAANVVGDSAVVSAIVPVDGDAHDFEPTPNDVRRMADADVIFVNGAGFEPFINRLIANAGTTAPVITVSAGLPIRAFGQAGYDAAAGTIGISGEYACDDHERDEEHAEGDETLLPCDPHLWQDPTNVIVYATNMRDALITVDPANADTYQRNTAAYISALEALDAAIVELVATIPAEKRIIVTNHDSLGYFAARYGFTIVGIVLPGGGTNAEPSPREVAALADMIRALGVTAIFTENIGNDQLAQQIAQEAGIAAVQSLYTDALGAEGTPGSTYIGMMTYNAEVIAAALGGK